MKLTGYAVYNFNNRLYKLPGGRYPFWATIPFSFYPTQKAAQNAIRQLKSRWAGYVPEELKLVIVPVDIDVPEVS